MKLKYILIHSALFIFSYANAQINADTTKTYTTAERDVFIPNYYRPIFEDKTLLFFNDSIVCDCHYVNQMYPENSIPSFKTDFKRVKECYFKKKLFIQFKGTPFEKPRYKFVSEKIVGELILIDENIFEYREFDSSQKITRSEKYKFQFSEIVRNLKNITFDVCFNEKIEKIIFFKTQKIK